MWPISNERIEPRSTAADRELPGDSIIEVLKRVDANDGAEDFERTHANGSRRIEEDHRGVAATRNRATATQQFTTTCGLFLDPIVDAQHLRFADERADIRITERRIAHAERPGGRREPVSQVAGNAAVGKYALDGHAHLTRMIKPALC